MPLWIEYEATLERDRIAAAHGLSFGEIDSLLDAWAVHVDPVELHYTWRPQLRDPKHEMVLQTAQWTFRGAGDLQRSRFREGRPKARHAGVESARPAATAGDDTMSNYALRIPNSLFDYAKRCAEEESVSMNQFFVMAIAEKVSALKTEAFFRERAGRAKVDRAKVILKKVRDVAPTAGDELVSVERVQEPTADYRVGRAAKAARKGKTRARKSR